MFAGACTSVTSTPASQGRHARELIDEWRESSGQRKRRKNACKVCSILESRGTMSVHFCGGCDNAPVLLCERAQHIVRGAAMSCWDIWHSEWRNGTGKPSDSRKIRRRLPAATAQASRTTSSPAPSVAAASPAGSNARAPNVSSQTPSGQRKRPASAPSSQTRAKKTTTTTMPT